MWCHNDPWGTYELDTEYSIITIDCMCMRWLLTIYICITVQVIQQSQIHFYQKTNNSNNKKWKTYAAITLSNWEDLKGRMVSFHSAFVYNQLSHLTTTRKFVQWDSRVHHSNENSTPVTWIYRHFSYSLNTKVWRSSNTPISEGILPERSLASTPCQSRDYWMRKWYCW